MKNINNIIKEEINKFILNENLSGVVYHFTNMNNLISIINYDSMYLTYVDDNKNDDFDKNYSYFLSLTRQRDGRLGYSAEQMVRITFDGDLLNQKYHGKPVSFWNGNYDDGKFKYMNKLKRGRYENLPDELKYQEDTENEDRLFSNYPSIKNISKYIKRIDIMGGYIKEFYPIFKYLVNDSIYKDIVHIYVGNKSFNSLNSKDINYKFIENNNSNNLSLNDLYSLVPKKYETLDDYNCFINAIVYLCTKYEYYDLDKNYDEFIYDLIMKYGNVINVDKNKMFNDSMKLLSNIKASKGADKFYDKTLDNVIIPSLHKSNNRRLCRAITIMLKTE